MVIAAVLLTVSTIAVEFAASSTTGTVTVVVLVRAVLW